MRNKKNITKKGIFKKIFVKLCRLVGYEIIDQRNFYFPVSNKTSKDNLSILGESSISLPLGKTDITRPVKSLHVIIKTCTSVNLVTQNKKRIFEMSKSEYTFRTINSIINSLEFCKDELKKIKIKIFIIDYNSKKDDLIKINNKLTEANFEFKIINLKLDKFDQIKTINKNNTIIENNMKATMSSIRESFDVAKKDCDDLVYFVEDDYIHKRESIFEMISSYEKISSELNKDIFICPVDYPYLYKKLENSNIFIGTKYHWRTINETLLTFLTSKSLINKHWNNLILMCENEHSPFETPMHKIFEKELCISPIPSLAMHCTNVNSVFGLSPNMDWKKLWEANEN